MSVLVLLITAGALVAGGFLLAFAWAVRSGQFDDTTTPPVRMLLEPPAARPREAEAASVSDVGAGFSRPDSPSVTRKLTS